MKLYFVMTSNDHDIEQYFLDVDNANKYCNLLNGDREEGVTFPDDYTIGSVNINGIPDDKSKMTLYIICDGYDDTIQKAYIDKEEANNALDKLIYDIDDPDGYYIFKLDIEE